MKILVLNPPTEQAQNVIRDILYGCWCKGKRIGGAQLPPLSLLCVATILKMKHQVIFVDAQAESRTIKEVQDLAKDCDMVIISIATMTFNEDARTLSRIKEANPSIKTVIFGSHPTFMPRCSLAKDSIDIIVMREPEFIIRDLADRLDRGDEGWRDVRGIGYKKDDQITINGYYPFIEDLDLLPFPDRGMLPKDVDYFNPLTKRMPYTTTFTSRGCPGRCIFCTDPIFHGKKVRFRSAENVIEELTQIKAAGYKEVFFRDETFTFFKERNVRIAEEMIKRKLDLTWICNSRMDTIDKKTMQIMKRAGCHMIKFGVESCVQKILDNLKKGTTVEQIERVFKWAHEVGINTHAHVMIGNPGDTSDTIKETVRMLLKFDPTTATFGVNTPYPGTELFERVKKTHPEIGDGTQADLSSLHVEGLLTETYCQIPKNRLGKLQRYAYRRFYLRPFYVLKWFGRIRNMDELKRIVIAATQLFSFSIRGE